MVNIESYIGLPYVSHGRTREAIDCFGILQMFYMEQFGIELDGEGFTYANASISEQVERDLRYEESKRVWSDSDELRFGDVLLFRIKGFVSHVGIVIDVANRLFLHSFPGRDSCIESMESLAWKKRIVGIKRHVDVN